MADTSIDLKSSLDFDFLEDVDEDAKTLEGNAYKKAIYTFQKTGLSSLADDTGLEVDSLDGRPGVYAARYAGENATYKDNVNKLLKELDGVANRNAKFRTSICFVSDEGTFFFEGICEGTITLMQSGTGGFGYDPVFKPNGYSRTFAELNAEEKNTISHRGLATKKFVTFLKSID